MVDVVSYGQRSQPEQERIQDRLQALLRAVVTDVGDDFDEVDRDSGTGDGMVVFPPTGVDPTERLPALLASVATRLAATTPPAGTGSGCGWRSARGVRARRKAFAGPLVVNISRLVDSEPLRRAVAGNPDADLVVLVLDVLHRRSSHRVTCRSSADRVELVDVAMKEFVDQAWLWVSTGSGW